MRSVKALVLITLIVVSPLFSLSQLKLPFANTLQPGLEKILRDYPNQFKNITGDELSRDVQTTDYQSSLTIPGAEQCTITKYSAKQKEVYSWQALMLTTDNFGEARKKFKSIYSQLNNFSVHFNNQLFHFKGGYENPVEAKTFTSSIFSAYPENESVSNLKIELTMQYELLEWKIKILVYAREREDNERGPLREGR
jgi:hypothetical protein